MNTRPDTLGVLVWPYVCADWRRQQRLEKIISHCKCIDAIGLPLTFSTDEYIPLLDLSEIEEGLHAVLEQPQYFMREGLLTLSLFKGATRMFSLAFSLERINCKIIATIGAVQGRDIQGILDQYRGMTKSAHGLRPRDLLIELFRMLCREIGVAQILAVSDEVRHHRSSYFGDPNKTFPTNYNDIWNDRGGRRIHRRFFEIEVDAKMKPLQEISAKKRGMYRKRYETLDSLNKQIHSNFRDLMPVPTAGALD